MRKLALIPLMLTLPSLAVAADYDLKENLPKPCKKIDAYVYDVGVASMEGVVEVPLLAEASGPANLVMVTWPESAEGEFETMRVAFDSASVTVTEGFAGTLGLEPKEVQMKVDGQKTGVQKVVTIPSISVGDLVLEDVKAIVGSENALGASAFADLAVAVLPSKGVARFAPASQGAELTAAVGGTAFTYEHFLGESFKLGRHQYESVFPEPLLIDGAVNGQETTLRFGSSAGVSRSLLGDSQPFNMPGVAGDHAVSIKLGKMLSLDTLIGETPSQDLTFEPWGATLGADHTLSWDMAVDPASQTLAINIPKSNTRASTFEATLSDTLKGLEPDEDGVTPEGEAAAPTWSALVGLYSSYGDLDKAEEYAAMVVEATPDACDAYMTLAGLQLQKGNFKKAAGNYAKASELYAPWGELSYEERTEFEEYAAEAEEGEELEYTIQPHSCSTAWGSLAETQLASRDYDAVAETYKAQRDLDAHLALIAGNSYLAQGRAVEAEAAYRQYLLLTHQRDAYSAMALALVQEMQGKTDQSLVNYRDAAMLDGGLLYARAYGQALTATQGAEAAAKALSAMADADATNPHWYLAAQEFRTAAGMKANFDRAIKGYERQLATGNDDAELHAGLAAALTRDGKRAKAKAAALTALEKDPRDYVAKMTIGDIAAFRGNQRIVNRHYRRAAMLGVHDPVMAGLLGSELLAETPVKVKLTKEKIEITDKVYFETGEATIKGESFDLLEQVAEIMMEHPEITMLSVQGHTDSRGKDRDNMELSTARAEAVANFLTSHGVEAERVNSQGFGETTPIVDEENEDAWAKNRRVEFVITATK